MSCARGGEVIPVADTEPRARLAEELGATAAVVVAGDDGLRQLPERVRSLTDGAGADFYFELVGTRATTAAGLALLGRAGCFV
jgi:threonine dehydrogenase-like Zn-dependent dehydrogenase